MSSCRALLCATLLIAAASAFPADNAALPRRFLNTSSLLPTLLPTISDDGTTTSSLPTTLEYESIPQPTSVSTIASSIGQPSSGTVSSQPTSSDSVPPVYTIFPSTPITSTASCTASDSDEPLTVWVILPNPTTITVTLGGNYTATLPPTIPEFTPPTFCPDPVTTTFPPINFPGEPVSSIYSSSTPKGILNPTRSTKTPKIPDLTSVFFSVSLVLTIETPSTKAPVTTIITTSKNPVTKFTSAPAPVFPGGDGGIDKQTVDPAADPGPNGGDGPFPTQPPLSSASNQEGSHDTGIFTTIQGVLVEIEPSYAVIGGATYTYEHPPEPTGAAPGSDLTTALQPTNVVIIDCGVFSAIGSSVAVFDGQTLLYGASSTFTTDFHQETITLGASISFDGTTIGGAANTGTQLGIAGGISVTQIGQSVAVVSSTSLTVGPQAVVTTVFIDTYTIVANSGGLEVAGTTLSYPFNPATLILTFGGITVTQIGSTILVIGGTTYTIGPNSGPTRTSPNRQTISIGSKTDGSATTTTKAEASPTNPDTAAETSKENDGRALRPVYILLGICLVTCIGSMI